MKKINNFLRIHKSDTFTDTNNGHGYPMTAQEVLDLVKDAPFSTSPDENFFFTQDGLGYPIKTIGDILDIEILTGE